MKILYSLPHPADRLENERAGHTVRANALLREIEALGHTVVRVEAADGAGLQQRAVSYYRGLVKQAFPRQLALMLRDVGRVQFGRAYGNRLIEIAARVKPDVILETHIGFSLGGAIASRKTGIPLALDDVSPWWEEGGEYGTGLKSIARAVHRRVTSVASIVVAVNETMRGLLLEDGIDPGKVIVVPNGVRPEFLSERPDSAALRAELSIPENAVVILFVGSFQHYHNVGLLLDAYERLSVGDRPLHLLLVGGGSEGTDRLGHRADVTVAGWVKHDRIIDFLALGDIAVMPGTLPYGNPMKVYEYLSMGKPVVAPDVPTVREIVRPSIDGLLFPSGDAAALASALQRLVDDLPLRLQMGCAGKAAAPAHQWARRAETLLTHLERVVHARTGHS